MSLNKSMKQQLLKKLIKISQSKKEPKWMLDLRVRALDIFFEKKMPDWGADLSKINFDNLIYFKKSQKTRQWSDVPKYIKKTFDELGIPEAEKKYLAGVGAQYESEMFYHKLKDEWTKKGIIFLDTDSALQEQPNLVKKYFGKIIPAHDNKFAALNTAFWSGGSFLYLPKNVKVDIPIQAFFRIDTKGLAQFERTIIIADQGSEVQYIEGCSAPIFSEDNLHAGVVEVFVEKEAKVRYSTIQNWSNNVYNLVTKRAIVKSKGVMEWIDGNLGSKVTMKYPSSYLIGNGARTDILSIARAGQTQQLDTGTKIFHLAANTTSVVNSKSISQDGGHSTFRALIKIGSKARGAKTKIVCNGLILDNRSHTNSIPTINVSNDKVSVEHEATISSVSEDQLFYLQTRGFSEAEATSMIVNGFISPIIKKLPMEYAIEINKLIEMNINKSVI